MKNLTYLPFKKNRYFTGKLLTAEDFEQEQRYFDDKRRLINRWVLGAGIVAGLEIIRVDDYNISLEMGLALDHTGREIVVDTPTIRKLSLIEGFEAATAVEGAESLYLCIEYDQIPTQPVHNITSTRVHTKEEETYNKYLEGYRLFITDEVPGGQPDQADADIEMVAAIRERAELIQQKTYQQGICLARIELVKAGDFYMIEKILPPPADSFMTALPIYSRELQALRSQVTMSGNSLTVDGALPQQIPAAGPEPDLFDWQFAQGAVSISIPTSSRAGHCLFSPEVAHGLGLGNVEVILHVRQHGYGYSGAEAIFPDEDKTAEAAARVDFGMGTFVVGIRLLAETREEEIIIGWTAIRKRSRNEFAVQEPRIYINPGIVNLKTRESIQLNAVCVNMDKDDLRWSVKEDRGGSIDQSGLYQAPNTPGVYEVSCAAKTMQQVNASVFIIVRE